ncbi:unnamed protein product [Brassica oleracea var. botrytis]
MVIGISMNLDEISMVRIHENAFDEMTNLRFLKFYKKSLEMKKEVRWLLPERFDNFPDKLKLLSWPGCPMVYMPSSFCPEYLAELIMPNAKLVKLWEGVEASSNIFSNCLLLKNGFPLKKRPFTW